MSKLQYDVASSVVTIAGLLLLLHSTNWKITLAAFLILFGNNLYHSRKYPF